MWSKELSDKINTLQLPMSIAIMEEEIVGITGPAECLHNWSAKFDQEDYSIKCVGGRQLHEY